MNNTILIFFSLLLVSTCLLGQSKALDLDGVNDYVDLGDVIENFSELSIEAWIKRGTASHSNGYEEIITKDLVSGIAINQSNNRLILNYGNGLTWGTHIDGTTIINTDQWYHVAKTRDALGNMNLYVNGKLEANGTNNSQGGNGISRTIGNKLPSYDTYFAGQLDEIRVWNTVRTIDEIRQNMHKTLTGAEANLEAYYSFDNATTCNGTSNEIADDSANSFDGTCQNMDNTDIINSTAPIGTLTTVNNISGHQNQSQDIGVIRLDDTADPFDNTQDIFVTRISNAPNTTSGISESNVAESFFVINIFDNGGTAGTFSVNLTFPDPTVSGGTVALYHRAMGSLGNWSLIGTTSPSGGKVTFTGISSFSQFVLASNALLPVELIHFSGRKTNLDNILLNWKTASEVDNKGFQIEHSLDGQLWEELGFVKGAGNSENLESYNFIHTQPGIGTHLYRLKQIDSDNSFSYSKIISLSIQGKAPDPVIFPNPVINDQIFIQFPQEIRNERVHIQLYDLSGQVLLTKEGVDGNIHLDTRVLPSGIYQVQIRLGHRVWWEKLVVY